MKRTLLKKEENLHCNTIEGKKKTLDSSMSETRTANSERPIDENKNVQQLNMNKHKKDKS